MNSREKLVAAIDIGTTKIVAIIGKQNENGKFEIIGLGKAPSEGGVKRGVVINIESTVNSIKKAVKQAEEASGVTISDVYVGIAGQHIRSIRSRGYINTDDYDEITDNDVKDLISDMYQIPIDAGEEILHVLPQSFIVDSETGLRNPVGISGKRLEANFHIVIGQVASANNIKKCIERVGLRTTSLVLEPLASSDAVLSEDEKEVGVALVDIGGGTTDVAVYHDGIISHTAVIPFGGDVVTNDIKEGCSILGKMAESLKVQYGSSLADYAQADKFVTIPGLKGRAPKEISFKNLAHIIQARMEEIIDAVYFEIETSGIIDKLGAGIVLTGGGSLLKHLPQLVSFKTGMDVRVGYPNEHLTSDVSNDINQPMFSTSIGLVLKGFEDNTEVEEPVAKEKVEVEIEAEEKVEKELVEETNSKKGIFGDLKNKFGGFFEPDDAQM